MTRRRIAIVGLVVILLAGAAVWWRMGRGGTRPKPPVAAADDPWGDSGSADRALAAKKRAARGDTPVDSTPASLSGHVRRAADGSPVAGAVVSVTERQFAGAVFGSGGGDEETLIAVTDAGGAWTLPAVPPGRRVVTATAVELLPASVDLVLAPRAARTGVDLSLAGGGITISGTVSDIGGGPIADAHVTVRPEGMRVLDTSAELVAVTGDDGRYRMTLPPDSWNASAGHPDYAAEEHTFVLRDRPLVVDFSLTPGGTVRGQVIARDTGKPLAGARVNARGGHGGHRDDDDIGGIGGVTTDDDGRFTLHGLGSGALSLTARARGYTSQDPTVVEVGIGEEVDGVQVLVDRAYTISGFVVRDGTEGDGVPGVRVGVFSIAKGYNLFAQEPSAADGYFEIVGVRPATYLVVAMGDDVMLEIGKSITVDKADLTDVIVSMDTGTTLSGKVSPPAVAQLSLSMDSDKIGIGNMFDVARGAMVRGSSDATGAFTLKNAPHGSFTLVAETSDGRTGKLPVTIGAADQTGLVVTLEDRGAISGKVVDANRAPVGGVHVQARSTKHDTAIRFDESAGEAITAPDGTYRVTGLDPGEIDLEVSDDNGPLEWADAEAATAPNHRVTRTLAGTEELRDVVLVVEARDGVIRGVVLGVDHAPMPDVWVTARSLNSAWDQKMAAMRAEAESRARERDGGSGVAVHVEVSEGDHGPDDDDEDGSNFSDRGSGKTVLTGADGHFVMRDLRRGTYQVVAEATKGGVRAQQTGVKTGDTVTLVMAKLGVIVVAVTNAGAPVTSYDLSCEGPTDGYKRHVGAADGRYRLERLPPGKYSCGAQADAGTGRGETKLVGEAGALDIALGGWASVTGVVVDGNGAPRPGLVVIASGEGDEEGEGFAAIFGGGGPTTDASGRFEVGRLSPGKGNLMLFDRAAGFTPIVTRELILTAGQKLDLGKITGGDFDDPGPTGDRDGGTGDGG